VSGGAAVTNHPQHPLASTLLRTAPAPRAGGYSSGFRPYAHAQGAGGPPGFGPYGYAQGAGGRSAAAYAPAAAQGPIPHLQQGQAAAATQERWPVALESGAPVPPKGPAVEKAARKRERDRLVGMQVQSITDARSDNPGGVFVTGHLYGNGHLLARHAVPIAGGDRSLDTRNYRYASRGTPEQRVSQRDSEIHMLESLHQQSAKHLSENVLQSIRMVVVGTTGPCDGCKDRLDQWQQDVAEMQRDVREQRGESGPAPKIKIDLHHHGDPVAKTRGALPTHYGINPDNPRGYVAFSPRVASAAQPGSAPYLRHSFRRRTAAAAYPPAQRPQHEMLTPRNERFRSPNQDSAQSGRDRYGRDDPGPSRAPDRGGAGHRDPGRAAARDRDGSPAERDRSRSRRRHRSRSRSRGRSSSERDRADRKRDRSGPKRDR
jgi:hypothetical protein